MMSMMPNRAGVHSFFLVLVILLPIIVVFTLFLSSQFSKHSFAEMIEVEQKKVEDKAENMDFFLNNLKAYGLTMYQDYNINGWLNSEDSDPFQLESAKYVLNNYMIHQPFLTSYYLINMRTRTVYDSLTGGNKFETFQDKDILRRIIEQGNSYLRIFRHTIGSQSLLSMVLPSSPTRTNNYGYMVLFLNEGLVRSFFLTSDKATGIDMYIKDQDGTILIGPENKEYSAAFVELAASHADEGGSSLFDYEGEKWSIVTSKLSSQNWTMYSISQKERLSVRINDFRSKIILYLILLYVIVLLVMFIYFQRTGKPIQRISLLLQQRTGKLSPTASKKYPFLFREMKSLETNFQLMIDNWDTIDRSMKKHRNIIREERLRQWILQGSITSEVRAYLEEESKLLKSHYLNVTVIRIDSYQTFCETYDFSSRKLLKYAMENIIDQLIQEEGWEVEVVDIGSDHLVVITGTDQGRNADYSRTFNNIGNQIKQWLKITTSIASSGRCYPNDNIREVYDKVLDLTMLKFIKGEDKVYVWEDYEALTNLKQSLPDEKLLEAMILSVRKGKEVEMNRQLDLLFEHLRKQTYDSCKQQLIYIYYYIAKSFSKMKSITPLDNLEPFLDRFTTLDQIRDWLQKLLLELIEKMNEGSAPGRKEEIAAEIVAFVKNRIRDPSLTQEEIAKHLSLSYSYIRVIFKEVANTTLADYILAERITLARELLRTTKLTMMEIAAQSGFQSKSHFFTAFKKSVGLTPNEYRLKPIPEDHEKAR